MQTRHSAHRFLLAAAIVAAPAVAAAQVDARLAVVVPTESASAAGARRALRTLEQRRYVIAAPDDASLAQVKVALDAAGAQFRKNFGVEAPRVRVQLADDVSAPVSDASVDPAAAARGAAPDPALRAHTFVWPAALTDAGALEHAACHALVIAWADEKRAAGGFAKRTEPVRGAHAAHEKLPAWFAEGAAGLCEPEAVRARRWATAGSAIANRAPLAELFGTSAAADVAPGFAWQSLALIEYVAAEKGERAVGRLAESLLAGRTTAEALTALKLDVATLDASWAQWAAAHVARGGSE